MKSNQKQTMIDMKLLEQKEVLKKFPKIELHRHLEGTFNLKTLYSIAKKNGIDVPGKFDVFKQEVQFPKDSEPDFLLFLSKFRNNWYRTFDDVYKIAYDSIKSFSDDGIFFIEVRFSPEHFAFHNNFDRKDITKTIIEAGNAAAKEKGFGIRYLITFNRSKQRQEEMIELYKVIRSLNAPEIVGIDLAGDELNYPAPLFIDFFDLINNDGIFKTTVHAGEVTPPSTIWDSLKLLKTHRIGHGTTTIEDERLQRYLIEKRIVLEQCITSNYQTGSWVEQGNHPMGELYRNGVLVTINSDDPSIQNSDLTDDYIKAIKYFDFTFEDLTTLNLRALEGSFLSEDEKKNLKAKYLKNISSFKSQFLVA